MGPLDVNDIYENIKMELSPYMVILNWKGKIQYILYCDVSTYTHIPVSYSLFVCLHETSLDLYFTVFLKLHVKVFRITPNNLHYVCLYNRLFVCMYLLLNEYK